jgi:DNA-directed RNA polymerase subunit RPC12/RpoP
MKGRSPIQRWRLALKRLRKAYAWKERTFDILQAFTCLSEVVVAMTCERCGARNLWGGSTVRSLPDGRRIPRCPNCGQPVFAKEADQP